MDHTSDEYWERISPDLAKYYGLYRLSIEEAQAAFDDADDDDLTDDELNSIVRFAKSGREESPKLGTQKGLVERLKESLAMPEILPDMQPVLNRNVGELDKDVAERIRKRREEVLKEYDGEAEQETPLPGEEEEGA